MKLISWNVNGLRAILKKGFVDWVKQEKPDVLCLQETKCSDDDTQLDLPGYRAYWNCAQKKGYAGTATLTQIEPLAVQTGMGKPEFDGEGRLLTLEFRAFYLINVYTPNSQRTLDRLPYRMAWDKAFLAFLKRLEKKKPVVFCGDLNVAHQEIDLANPKANRGEHGFTDEERAGFQRILDSGFVDTFRLFEKGGGHYTWWSQRPGVRQRNIGWRIDYFCVSKVLVPKVKASYILKDVMGSDHAPIVLELAIES